MTLGTLVDLPLPTPRSCADGPGGPIGLLGCSRVSPCLTALTGEVTHLTPSIKGATLKLSRGHTLAVR